MQCEEKWPWQHPQALLCPAGLGVSLRAAGLLMEILHCAQLDWPRMLGTEISHYFQKGRFLDKPFCCQDETTVCFWHSVPLLGEFRRTWEVEDTSMASCAHCLPDRKVVRSFHVPPISPLLLPHNGSPWFFSTRKHQRSSVKRGAPTVSGTKPNTQFLK